MKAEFNARRKMKRGDKTYNFSFYCHYCRTAYTTSPITAKSEDKALAIAKKRAQPYFNLCHKCGRWVCDTHYNEDLMQCVVCAPNPQKVSVVNYGASSL